MSENGNGELRKLIEARRRFLEGFHVAAKEFDDKLEQLRDTYLEEITYTALNDPYLTEVQKALRAKAEKAMAPHASDGPAPPAPEPKTPICPSCGSEIADENASFCSQCAAPLKEDEKTNAPVVSAGRLRVQGRR